MDLIIVELITKPTNISPPPAPALSTFVQERKLRSYNQRQFSTVGCTSRCTAMKPCGSLQGLAHANCPAIVMGCSLSLSLTAQNKEKETKKKPQNLSPKLQPP